MDSKKQIVVACAIVQMDGKVLVVQRGHEKSRAEKWEFPGGKLQQGEMLEQCVVREVQEELKVTIEAIGLLEKHVHTYPDIVIELHAFVCRIDSEQEIVLTEHLAFEWVEPLELVKVDLSEADKYFLPKLFSTQ